jgi:hypothetical protein
MNIVRLSGALFLSACIISCGTGGNYYKEASKPYPVAPSKNKVLKKESLADMKESAAAMSEDASDQDSISGEGNQLNPPNKQNAESYVIYEADCVISVRNVRDSVKKIDDMLKINAGYIEQSSSSDSYRGAYIVVRIPLAAFENFVESLGRLGVVEKKEISATNVSDQVSELSIRIASLERVRARLNDLLKKAREAGDKIAILKEIDRIQSLIESVTAQVEYLKKMSAYSTVRITLNAERQDTIKKHLESPFEWIRNLNPGQRSISKRSSVKFICPEGYFDLENDFDKEGKYLFTLPGDITGIREGETENYPFMNADFWKGAFETDLKNRMYKIVQWNKSGDYFVYHLAVQGGKYYTVAFAVSEKKIIVIETSYDSEKTYLSEHGTIEKMIAAGKLK